MFDWSTYQNNNLFGLKYLFRKRGDGIPMHSHEDDQKHNIVVLRGSVAVYGPSKSYPAFLHAGDVFDIPDEMHPHEVVALEDNTLTLGLFIHGRPAWADTLEGDDLFGSDQRPITIPL